MSEITRRQAIGQLAAAFAAGVAVDHWLATELHAQLRSAGATSGPKALSPQQFRTLERLTDLIIPVENGKPGALQAGVPAWIDALLNVNEELKARYVTGLAWLDQTMTTERGTAFLSATPAQQTALLDVIAFKENRTPDNAPGVDFFILARRMTVDGFYTSDLGIRDINPGGRPPHDTFVVPQEAVNYVISRSPFK
jgi:gluconate 2-dehydrogenase subunit 3-like protein